MIRVKDVQVKKRRNLSVAHVIFEDTGKTRDVEREDADGKKFVETVPVRRKKFVEAVNEDYTETEQRHCVDDAGETHEFADEKQAKNFLKWKGRGA